MIIHLGNFINHNILWFVPIVTVFLGVIFRIFECYQERINFYKVFDFGLDLITSSIILLVTNHQSEVTIWLILFFFIICMIILIIRQRNFNKYTRCINLRAMITSIIAGFFLLTVAIMHIDSFLNLHIDYCIETFKEIR